MSSTSTSARTIRSGRSSAWTKPAARCWPRRAPRCPSPRVTRRTRIDFAHCIQDLVDVHYPAAAGIVLVLDHLNTHTPASRYAAFPPAEATRLADTLESHYPPTHGRWLNMAEIELSALQRQCLARRLGTRAAMEHEVAAWVTARHTAATTVDWRFTTADARIKLKRLSPAFHA